MISALGYLLLTCAALAQVGQIPAWPPKQFIASGGGYTGPLDVISPAFYFVSVRCAATAYTGNVMDVFDAATGSTTETLITCSSGGVLNTSSPTALATTCASGCRVKTWYDQSGANNCSAAPCNFTNATNATRPALLNFATPASWLVSFTNANSTLLNSPSTAALTAPYPLTVVAAKTGSFTAFNYLLKDANGNMSLSGGGAINTLDMVTGPGLFFTASDSVLHSMQFNNANGASSTTVVDGVASTVTMGSSSIAGAVMDMGHNNGAQFGDFNVGEVGFFPTSTWTPTQYGNLCHNQRLYFGTPGSC